MACISCFLKRQFGWVDPHVFETGSCISIDLPWIHSISTDLSNVLGNDPKEEKDDPKIKTIKTLLGTDWAKAVGLKESEAQLKLTEMQAEALLAGNTALE